MAINKNTMSRKGGTTTRTSPDQGQGFGFGSPVPGILVAHAPEDSVTVDRCLVSASFILGRSSECDLCVRHHKVSKRHFRITRNKSGFYIEDLGSTNGTYVNGTALVSKRPLSDGDIIRAGSAVLVFHSSCAELLEAPAGHRYDIAGRFHAAVLIKKLEEASLSSRHILLAGPTGTGKELAANVLAWLMGESASPLSILSHNCARFASKEEASVTLFGVAARVFSNVDARKGLIEQSHGNALFLDEVHNLPLRVQKALLRVIEDGETARIGETKTRPAQVRFIMASNAPGPDFSLAHDLLARLRVVEIPSLSLRRADIPSIFDYIIKSSTSKRKMDISETLSLMSGDHYEAMCLDGFESDNVRGLVDLADKLITRINAGTPGEKAVATVFAERFGHGPVSLRYSAEGNEASSSSGYDRHKNQIIAACTECGGNLSATERLLKKQGIQCSRRWLMVYLEKWGVRVSKQPANT